ncbi:MAG: hydroxymethylglutaryl-CoA synthase [Verrucomicrobiota bacterium]|jgi:hydroxymethylglutaryl-CoA synthase|nr:hydroxymethylglutaryl-CoA synthase [Verrucomicrobiota bacterium]
MKIGIDLLCFHTPSYVMDLRILAEKRGVDPDKFTIGIGQERMAVLPPDQDIVTLAANAALPVVEKAGRDGIELLIFATESGIDQSKAAALFCHKLLNLPATCRCIEVKEACYGGTAALRLAATMVAARPHTKALVLAADVARYDLASPGEPTQGAGAVAMLVSTKPRILALDPETGFHAEDVMDFWRPNYREEALVDGKYSTRMYLTTLIQAWKQYTAASGRGLADHAHYCFHLPFTKIAYKAYSRLCKAEGTAEPPKEELLHLLDMALGYNRQTGNTYAACVYESLSALLDNMPEALDDKRIGLFSYGSGCMAEFFSGVVQRGYRAHLFTDLHRTMLDTRTPVTYRQYEDIFTYGIPKDGADHVFAPYRGGAFRLAGIKAHKRRYEATA